MYIYVYIYLYIITINFYNIVDYMKERVPNGKS